MLIEMDQYFKDENTISYLFKALKIAIEYEYIIAAKVCQEEFNISLKNIKSQLNIFNQFQDNKKLFISFVHHPFYNTYQVVNIPSDYISIFNLNKISNDINAKLILPQKDLQNTMIHHTCLNPLQQTNLKKPRNVDKQLQVLDLKMSELKAETEYTIQSSKIYQADFKSLMSQCKDVQKSFLLTQENVSKRLK
ncbi:Hypothetical_protein [Hexamita inflata]|uniref:Hypothetical_protein n=1 Tax=Hexamita inflata TaxID=28002 RepID=A0AA86P032_9EUKA|nr:Hypothetical protein HINF_LOCUS16701 [Hexamita inflata]